MSATSTSDRSLPSLAGAGWLVRAETQAVLGALSVQGFSARVVGGAVRNALLDRPVVDIDIATTARPEETMAAAAAAGLGAVPTGIAHGTVTVIANHVPFEVTTLREDVETFGRHARVAFTEDWAADARRRDFTINALYCDAAGTVSDPLGGYGDLLARRVRFIGDADERIREDYLRILRFFRFHAEYGHAQPDAASLEACVRARDGLARLSGERIRAELLRLLAAGGVCEAVAVMAESGILTSILDHKGAVDALVRLVAIETAVKRPPDPVLRLAALALPDAEPARLRDRLRLSAREAERLQAARRPVAGLSSAMTDVDAKVAIYRMGHDAFVDALLLAWARTADSPMEPGWRRLLALAGQWQPPRMPLRGADLLARGVAPGPRIGELIAAFEDWWVAEGFPVDHKRSESAIDALVSGRRP